MAKFKSNFPNAAFSVKGERYKFRFGEFQTEDKEVIAYLEKLADVKRVDESKKDEKVAPKKKTPKKKYE